jgi:adenylate cyclase
MDLGVSIVIGPETARQIGDRLPLVPLETIHVKGKEEAILVHTVVPELGDRLEASRELRELQAKLSAKGNDISAMVERAVSIAPSLAGYHALAPERRRRRATGR